MKPLGDKLQAVKIGQIFRLVQLGEYGRETKELLDASPSSFSRDIGQLEEALGGLKLVRFAHGESELTAAGKLFVDLFNPWIQLCQRIDSGEIANLRRTHLRIGAGGSLATWLIGSRISQIKGCIRQEDGKPGESHPHIALDVQAFRNRDTILQVASGSLDCGLVREGVLNPHDKHAAQKRETVKEELTHPKIPVKGRYLGTVKYCIYVPESLLPSKASEWDASLPMPDDFERIVLSGMPIATVGPHGEFRRNLNAALYDAILFPNIEYSYRAFPMLLPHMQMRTHVTIMPDVNRLTGAYRTHKGVADFPGYRKFPLRLLAHHTRRVYLAYSKDHFRRVPRLDIDALTEVLKF